MMFSVKSTIAARSLLLALCFYLAITKTEARVVAYQYQEGSASCKSLSGDWWDIDLGHVMIDCGNANHGCTAGHSMLIDADCTYSIYTNYCFKIDYLFVTNSPFYNPYTQSVSINTFKPLPMST